MNAKERLDLMNEKLKERDLPLNYFDYDRNIFNLNKKKQLMTEIAKVELTDEQKDKIKQQVESAKSKKMEERLKENEDRKKALADKLETRKKEAESLKARIEELAEKKVLGKKDGEGHLGETEELKKGKKKYDTAKLPTQTNPVSNYSSRGKQYRSNKNPHDVKFLTHHEREDLFTFNHPLQNKNITFKKVANNPEQYMRGSRSPSPINTTGNFCELKRDVFAKNFDRTVTCGYNSGYTSGYNSTDKAGAGLPQTTSEDKSAEGRTGKPTRDVLNAHRGLSGKTPVEEFTFDNNSFPVWKELDQEISHAPRGQQSVMVEQLLSDAVKSGNADPAIEYFAAHKDKLLLPNKLRFLKTLCGICSAAKDPQGVKQCLVELHTTLKDEPSLANQHELCQHIALSIAELEIADGRGESALAILKSDDFVSETGQSPRYENAYSVACHLSNKQEELAARLIKQIEDGTSESFRHLDIRQLFANISQLLELLNASNNIKQLVRFCQKIMSILQQVKKVNQGLELKEHDYENLIECHLLNCLRFAKRVGNYNLSNFLIGENIKNQSIDYVHNMNEDERKELIARVLEFCWQLKALEDYGGYQENYIKYLDYAKDVNK